MASIPKIRMLGAYRVKDVTEFCFAFNERDQHRVILSDVLDTHLSELELNRELKIVVKNAPPVIESENITIIAENHYTNLSFIVELKFTQGATPLETEIIWIIILVIGFIMIIGLVCVWSRQSKKTEVRDSIKESLLTVDAEFKANFINRSSVDPESVRGTVEYKAPVPAPAPAPVAVAQPVAEAPKELQKEQIEEKIDPTTALEEKIEVPKPSEETLEKL